MSNIDVPQNREGFPFSDEWQSFKQCRVKSIWYGGIPLGLICVGCTSAAYKLGMIAKAKSLYTGVFIGGFALGSFSYSYMCSKKFMALMAAKNRTHGDVGEGRVQEAHKLRNDVPQITELQNEATAPVMNDDNEFEGPLSKRLEGYKSWDEIRMAARQPINGKGISYEELRLRNQPNLGHHKNLTREEDDDLKRKDRHLPSESSSSNFSRTSETTRREGKE